MKSKLMFMLGVFFLLTIVLFSINVEASFKREVYDYRGTNTRVQVNYSLMDARNFTGDTMNLTNNLTASTGFFDFLGSLANQVTSLFVTQIEQPRYIQFNLTFDDGSAEGRLQWNQEDGALEFGMPGGEVNLQIGQEMLVRARNTEGITIQNCQAVFINGATGNVFEINTPIASNLSEAPLTFALATENITNNNLGYITFSGLVRGCDTSAWNEGDVIYLSDTEEGNLTNIRPIAPNMSVVIGIVRRSHQTEGEIGVKPVVVQRLSLSSDVYPGGLINNAILFWNTITSRHEYTTTPTLDNLTVLGNINATGNIYGELINARIDLQVNGTNLSSTNLNHTSGSDLVGIPVLNGASYQSLHESHNLFNSAGRITGGTISEGAGSTINVSSGTGFIRAEDNDIAELMSFDWEEGTGFVVPTNTIMYYGIDYNSGNPIVINMTTEAWDLDTQFPLGSVINQAGELYILDNPWWISDSTTNIIERFESEGHLVRDEELGGLILGVTGTRNPTMSSGKLWSRLNEHPISSFDSSIGDTFDTYYRDGVGGYAEIPDQSQYNITHYDDGSGTLQPIGNNQYAVLWTWVNVAADEISIVYPQQTYPFSAAAETEEIPNTFPDMWYKGGIIIGRIIIKQGQDAPVEVQSVFTTTFTAAQASDHGNLAGLTDDDHTQYLLTNGSRGLTGNWNAVFNITTSWFKGKFNWTTIGNILSFDGSTLSLNESNINGSRINNDLNWINESQIPDVTGERLEKTINQASHGFITGHAVYYNGSDYLKALANDSETLGTGLVSVIDSNNFIFTQSGFMSIEIISLTAGQYYFVSESDAGNLTSSEGSTFSNPILQAANSTSGYVRDWRASTIGGATINGSQITNDLNWINVTEGLDAGFNSTFNSTYDEFAYNQSDGSFNSTYDSFAYNQTIPANEFTIETNNSLASFVDNTYAALLGGNQINGTQDFDGSWSDGGLTIVGGNIFAQTVYVYNLSSLAVSELNVNGSFIPSFDNVFDLGSSILKWRDLFLGGEIVMSDGNISSNSTSLFYNNGSKFFDLTKGGNVPENAVMSFNQATCPLGWVLADGDNGTPDLRGIFVRGAGTSGVVNYANGTDMSATYGEYMNDSMQGHKHDIIGGTSANPLFIVDLSVSNGGNAGSSNSGSVIDQFVNTEPTTDGTSGTPRTGAETAPASYAMIYCVKTTEDTQQSNSIWQTIGDLIRPVNLSKTVEIVNLNVTGNLTVDGSRIVIPRMTDSIWQVMNNYGSGNTFIPKYTNEIVASDDVVVTVVNSAVDGFSVTANMDCIIHISTILSLNADSRYFGFSIDATAAEMDTTIVSIATAKRRSVVRTGGSNHETLTSYSGILLSGEVIRPHTDGQPQAADPARTDIIVLAIEKL